MNTTDDETTTTFSHETTLKIQEFKRLIYKYSQYHRNPGAVINCIVYYCNNGDNTLLDEKLEQLRTFDSMGYTDLEYSLKDQYGGDVTLGVRRRIFAVGQDAGYRGGFW